MATAIIIDKNLHRAERINSVDYSLTSIIDNKRFVTINEVLPFRIRFTTIGIEGYNSHNVPGIGLQVIGVSNWIL
jgi:hypothetical protein